MYQTAESFSLPADYSEQCMSGFLNSLDDGPTVRNDMEISAARLSLSYQSTHGFKDIYLTYFEQ